MRTHIVNGTFQSDKYPTCPPGKVPLSVKDPTAQDLLWEYAQRRRPVDAEFSDDLEVALRAAGYDRGAALRAPIDPDAEESIIGLALGRLYIFGVDMGSAGLDGLDLVECVGALRDAIRPYVKQFATLAQESTYWREVSDARQAELARRGEEIERLRREEPRLRVWTCGDEEWVIAYSAKDAAAVYAETGAEPVEGVPVDALPG